jgi:2-polyprenyl-3-methyl-5-hydroxy-6-metoxy-1,4-benzoquinol methylase
MTAASFDVLRCGSCGSDRLDPIAMTEDAYVTGEYRETVDGAATAAAYYENHDVELASKLALVGSLGVRGRTVGDIGCGAGTFLDLDGGLAERTIGIEPQADFRDVLTARGHTAYASAREASAAEPASMDIAFSFQTIEHVIDPVGLLTDAAACMKPGAELHVTTPNRDDVLMQLGGERYRQFFYRAAHVWYFDAPSLQETARRAGLSVRAITTPYRFDLSNFAVWLRDGRPSGLGRLPQLAGASDAAFRAHVEGAGMGDILYAVLVKA